MTYRKKYDEWKNYKDLDEQLKNELLALSEKEIEEAFYKNLEFGTGGLRAIMGVGTNRINVYTIRKITEGYACWLEKKWEDKKNKGVVITYDNRHLSHIFAIEVAKVLAQHEIKCFIFDSLRPTPELSFSIRYLNAIGGIAITASHNPACYNGYKIYDETGCQCVLSQTNEIIKFINEVDDELRVAIGSEEQCKRNIVVLDAEIDNVYYDNVLRVQLHSEIDKSDFRVVFSPQHGTTTIAMKELFRRAGYSVIFVESQSNPNPNFLNTKDPNPENPIAFEEGLKVAMSHNADCILSTDPDGDRLGIMVKHNGRYDFLSGNQIGVVLLKYIIEERKRLNCMPPNPIVYNSIVTSSLGDFICKKNGVHIEKTLTGFKFIGEKINEIENKNYNFIFGYEESNGYLISDFVRDKDGVQTCLFACEVINFYKKQNKSLIDVLHDIYDEYGYYKDSQKTFLMEDSNSIIRLKQFLEYILDNSDIKIDGFRITKIENFMTGTCLENGVKMPILLPNAKVIKLYLEDNSWIAIRPSGTEPKIKLYFFDRCHHLQKFMEDIINGFK